MKAIFAFASFSSFLAVVFAGKCIEQAECEAGTCCAGVPPFGGVCAAYTPEGGKCHVVDKTVPIFGDFYVGPCPCKEGLVCVQQGKKKNNGVCQVPPTTPAPTDEEVGDEATDASDDAVSEEVAEAEAAPVEEAAPAEAAAPAEE